MTENFVKILTVDDTTSLVSKWKAELIKYADLISVVGGFEAISKLKENPDIKLIIINLSLKHINGMDALEKIRKVNSQVPIIVLANKQDLRLVKEAVNYKIHGFLWIPVVPDSLISEVKKFVNLVEKNNSTERNNNIEGKDTSTKKVENGNSEKDLKQQYYEAQSCLLNNNIDKAIEIFTKISEEKKLKDSYLKYVEESYFQLGRCWLKKGNFKKAIDMFSTFLTKTADDKLTRQALFFIGNAYESGGEYNKAKNFYTKVINMGAFDSITTQAKKRLKKLN